MQPKSKTPRTQISTFLNLPFGLNALVSSALGLRQIEEKYDELVAGLENQSSPVEFCRTALSALEVSFDLPEDSKIQELRQIQGPLIFVANHPFGAIDALVLMTLMGEVRPQFKLMANAFLASVPELAPVILPVHISDSVPHSPLNIGALKSTLQYLLDGGLLGLFPAGEVSSLPSWRSRTVKDREWSNHLGRLVRKSGATVIPIHFEGQNGLFSQYVGLALPKLRIAMIAWETLRHRATVRLRMGRPIPFLEIGGIKKARALTEHLRDRVDQLGDYQRID